MSPTKKKLSKFARSNQNQEKKEQEMRNFLKKLVIEDSIKEKNLVIENKIQDLKPIDSMRNLEM